EEADHHVDEDDRRPRDADELAGAQEEARADRASDGDELEMAVLQAAMHLLGRRGGFGGGHDTPLCGGLSALTVFEVTGRRRGSWRARDRRRPARSRRATPRYCAGTPRLPPRAPRPA